MLLMPEWFGWLAAELKEADVAPLVWNLEGGYGPEQCSVAARHVIEGEFHPIFDAWCGEPS